MIDIRLKYLILWVTAIITVGLTACSSEDVVEEEVSFSQPLRVAAKIAATTHTRAYQEKGNVEEGIYYLAYPNSQFQYTLATVDFDREKAESPGLGVVTTEGGTELKWSEIGGSPVTFYLDNVAPSMGQPASTGAELTLDPARNPFVAGVFDDINGTNDLLWGDKLVARDTRSVSFDLHHNMSRLKVQVKVVHKDNSVEEIDLSEATVEITNLYPKTLSYNHTTGSLALDTISGRDKVLIVDPERENYQWADKIETSSEEADTTTYLSPDIVLPPQALLENEDRPQLVITLKDGTEYSGILPHAMLILSATDGSLSYPVTLAFLKEYILTIRTVITEEPPELAFMPVYVVDWVDKGEFTEEAHQSGIYTAAEFYRLIDYYQKDNQYQLVRYGYLMTPASGPLWHFDFWSSVVLDYNTIYRSMVPGSLDSSKGLPHNYEFSYNNYTIYVKNGDGENNIKPVTNTQLRGICTGALSWGQF